MTLCLLIGKAIPNAERVFSRKLLFKVSWHAICIRSRTHLHEFGVRASTGITWNVLSITSAGLNFFKVLLCSDFPELAYVSPESAICRWCPFGPASFLFLNAYLIMKITSIGFLMEGRMPDEFTRPAKSFGTNRMASMAFIGKEVSANSHA